MHGAVSHVLGTIALFIEFWPFLPQGSHSGSCFGDLCFVFCLHLSLKYFCHFTLVPPFSVLCTFVLLLIAKGAPGINVPGLSLHFQMLFYSLLSLLWSFGFLSRITPHSFSRMCFCSGTWSPCSNSVSENILLTYLIGDFLR